MPASRAAPFSSAPASSRTFSISRWPSSRITACRSTRPRWAWNAEDFDAGALEGACFRRVGRLRGEDDYVVLCGFHEFRAQRSAQARIHDGAEQRAAARYAGAVGEARIVGEDGADAGEERVGFVTQALDLFARFGAGDPRCAAGALGDLAVERERGFQSDERALGLNPPGEVFVVAAARNFRARRGAPSIPARCAAGEAVAGDGGIRIAHRGDDSFDAGGDDGFGARAGASGGAAGLERYVESGAAGFFAGFFSATISA